MGWVKPILLATLLISSFLVGCLSDDEGVVELKFTHTSLSGEVLESYSDGNLVSELHFTVEFDFSSSDSSYKIEYFSVGVDDGRESIDLSAKSGSVISIDFSSHGMYEVTLSAVDEKGNSASKKVTIAVDLRIDWREEATSNPMVLQFDPNPKNGGENPKHIDVSSTVENPSFVEDFSGGQSVEFLWKITDELDDVCQWNTGEVDDGQTQTWNTLHFNTYLIHELSVEYEEGQDLINIDQTVLITYDFD